MPEAAIAVQPRTSSDMYYFSAADGRLLGADTDGPAGNCVVTQFLDWHRLGDALVYTKIQRAAATPEDEYESTVTITWGQVDPKVFEAPSTAVAIGALLRLLLRNDLRLEFQRHLRRS